MLQEEYFVLMRENNDNYPLFSWDQSSDKFSERSPVKVSEPVKLRLGDPLPPNYEWVDFHKTPEPVVSEKISTLLMPLNIYGVQLLPAKVRDSNNKDVEVKDYIFMHVWNRIECLDMGSSELELYDDGSIFSIEKLVLDESKLGAIDLDKRLIFELEENISTILIHQSIKEIILSAKPVGFRFVNAPDWYSDIAFE